MPTAPPSWLAPFNGAVLALENCHNFFNSHLALNHLPAWATQPARGGVDLPKLETALAAARAELNSFEEHRRRSKPWDLAETDEGREGAILTICALRFDGYAYIDLAQFNAGAAVQSAIDTDQLPSRPLEQFASFFILQRMVLKFWDYLPLDGQHWRIFRELFFLCAEQIVPPDLIPEDTTWASRWRYRYQCRLPETIRFIRTIHQRTKYRPVP